MFLSALAIAALSAERHFLPAISIEQTSYQVNCSSRTSITTQYNYILLNCAFFAIAGSGNGGAVMISTSTSTAVVSSSVFQACTCTSSGGGFYINVLTFNMSDTCFQHCYSSINSQSFYAQVTTNANLSIKCCSHAFCSNSTLQGPYDGNEVWYGYQTHTYYNASYGTVSSHVGALVIVYGASFQGSWFNIVGCSIGSTLGNMNIYYTQNANFSYSNVINNSGGYVLSMAQYNGYIQHCVFNLNSGTLFNSGIVSDCWINQSSIAGYNSITRCSYNATSTLAYQGLTALSGYNGYCYIVDPNGIASAITCTFTFSYSVHLFREFGILVYLLCNE